MAEDIASREHFGASKLELQPRTPQTRPQTIPQLAVNQRTTCRWSLIDDVAAYSEAGAAGIGLWRPKLAEFGEERALELIRESGLAVSSLSWAGGFTGENGYSWLDAVADARDAIAAAGELGAGCLVLVSGPQRNHIRPHARRLLCDALVQLGDFAAQCGVTLAVQPMHPQQGADWTFLSRLDESLEILDACEHPAVGLAFDLFHLRDEAELAARIGELAPRVALVQLSDAARGHDGRWERCAFGEGELGVDETVQAFFDAGYRGFFEIEIWSERLWSGDLRETLRVCCDRFGLVCG
ncbi:MAG: sugar phosphate isomerase/epimerase [Planctomycetes bacterium]|nr:sugar phosphate isomerase/epimerase [Planctomycetota bacterium]